MCRPLDGRHIAIVGAGVAGLTAAMALVERGANVTIYERSSMLGRRSCAWVAGGMLAPYCERDGADSVVSDRGRLALSWWPQYVHSVTQRGSLVVAALRDRADLWSFAARTEGHQALDHDGIAHLEPDLAGRFDQALWFPDEAHLNPRQALPDLAQAFRERGGRIEFGVDAQPHEFGNTPVIDCRGLAARDALPSLRGVRGEMLLLRSRDVHFSRPVRFLHPRIPLYVVPREDGLLMLGATSIESDYDGPVSMRSAMELLHAAYALHPALAEADVVEFGVGVRPAFPDNVPRLLSKDRVVHFNGLYRHGFLLSPWYAEQLAAQMVESMAEAA